MQSVAVCGGQFHIRPAQNTEHSLSVKSPSKVQQNLDFQSMQEHETHHENDLHFVETLAEAVVQAHWAAVVADCFPELELVEVLVVLQAVRTACYVSTQIQQSLQE